METNLNLKKRGLAFDGGTLWFDTGWQYSSADPLFDGYQWSGSIMNLTNNLYLQIGFKTAPKVKFDYGAYCGFPNFEYVFVPIPDWSYQVYALTNNNTILQYVGKLTFSYGDYRDENYVWHQYIENGSVEHYRDPDENYVYVDLNASSFIDTNGDTWTYSHFDFGLWRHIWTNEQRTGYITVRNPYQGLYITNLNYNDSSWYSVQIDVVNYPSGSPYAPSSGSGSGLK